jgi:hypothetical protein
VIQPNWLEEEKEAAGLFCLLKHRPLTKGRITQQSSPERDESNAFSKNVFLASTEDKNLGTEPKFKLDHLVKWVKSYRSSISTTYTVVKSAKFCLLLGTPIFLFLF